jgi:hypothetical protein
LGSRRKYSLQQSYWSCYTSLSVTWSWCNFHLYKCTR